MNSTSGRRRRSGKANVDDDGVDVQVRHLDGSAHRFTPEISMRDPAPNSAPTSCSPSTS
jgi:hypothetical protein